MLFRSLREDESEAEHSSPYRPLSPQSLSRSPQTLVKSLPSAAPHSPAKPTLSIPLSSLSAFSSLPSQLQTLTTQIATSLTGELVAVLRVDLLDRIDRTVKDTQRAENDEGRALQISLEDRLRPLLHALVRIGAVVDAVKQWREIVSSEIRGVLKQVCGLASQYCSFIGNTCLVRTNSDRPFP